MPNNELDSQNPLSRPRNWRATKMLKDLVDGEISIHTSDVELSSRYGPSFALDRRVAFEELARVDGCLVLVDDTGINEQDEVSLAEVVATWPVNGNMDADALLSLANVHAKLYRDKRSEALKSSGKSHPPVMRRITTYRLPAGEFKGKTAAFFSGAGQYICELKFLEV